MVRKAFTLIELVVSIVVVGIAFMTIPLFLSDSKSNDEFALEQESILAAKTKVQNITSYRWDENSYDPVTGKVYILDTYNGDSELQRQSSNPCGGGFFFSFFCYFWNWFFSAFPNGGLTGQIAVDGRREMFATPTYPDISEINYTNPNDVDDFNGQVLNSLFDQESTGLDYLNSHFSMGVRAGFVDDSANYQGSKSVTYNFPSVFKSSGDSNIKMIEVNVTGVNTPFVLRYYSCNIGESEIKHKAFF